MEADLAFRGVDLLAAFQECRVRYLLNLVFALPRNTLTGEAMSQDKELVGVLTEGRADDEQPKALRMSEYSVEAELLALIADRVADVAAGQVALGGKRPPTIPAVKRPETAHDAVARERKFTNHERIKQMLLPNGPQPLPEEQLPEAG